MNCGVLMPSRIDAQIVLEVNLRAIQLNLPILWLIPVSHPLQSFLYWQSFGRIKIRATQWIWLSCLQNRSKIQVATRTATKIVLHHLSKSLYIREFCSTFRRLGWKIRGPICSPLHFWHSCLSSFYSKSNGSFWENQGQICCFLTNFC